VAGAAQRRWRDESPATARSTAGSSRRFAEDDADIAAGWLIDEADIDAWIDRIGTVQELTPPGSRR
jgi:hypothetical protein